MRRTRHRFLPCVFALSLAAACSGPTTPDAGTDAQTPVDAQDAADAATPPRNILETVAASNTYDLPGLQNEAHILYTEGDVPHVYAQNRVDLARVQGFVLARHRFFMMDMERRLAQGIVSQLFGEPGLATDLESRGTGMTLVTDLILRDITPDQQQIFDAFAEGVNAYIERVRAQRLPPPSEYQVGAALLGFTRAIEVMQPFARRDVAAMLATIVYNLGYETDDIGRAAAAELLPGNFAADAPLGDLRRAGARADVFNRVEPVHPVSSAAGFGVEGPTGLMSSRGAGEAPSPPGVNDAGPNVRGRSRAPSRLARNAPPVTPAPGTAPGTARTSNTVADANARPRRRGTNDALARLFARLERVRLRLHRVEGFGSNSWAVMGSRTTDGAALLAGDGHLPLTVPSLFYQIGLDTAVLGGGDFSQVGLTIPGIPMLAVGTNGRVAWCQTQLAGDITDWYRERITLDANGLPQSSLFRGESRPLMRSEESYTIANIEALNSRGRTEMWPRWTTFDGRLITSIEGRTVTRDEPLAAGESRVMMLGQLVVPSDTDGDGVITALSFDHPVLDGGNLLQALDGFGRANNVREFREATRGLVGYSQNIIAADRDGSVLYTSYQAVPCRGYLERNPDGSFAPGSDPRLLLDGTRYGGFRIPIRDGRVDEAPGASDPYACVVPFDRTPTALDPMRGYVLTANNDPGNVTTDNSVINDAFYVGGPWDSHRARRIDDRLRELTTNRTASEDTMAQLQGDHHSMIGVDFAPLLVEAIEAARTASMGTPAPGTPEARLAGLYRAASADYDEVARRLREWGTAGYQARSGVETFYHMPATGDREASVATSIFNAWFGRFLSAVLDDEPFPPNVWSNGGSHGRVRTLLWMMRSRGTNTHNLASYNTATGESAFFDVISTPEIESSREVMLSSLDAALAFLRSPPESPGVGGFGSNDMNAWVWGLRHHMRFSSLLVDFIGDNAELRPLIDGFSITTRQLPLAPNLAMNDPRFGITNFPRSGDQWAVDAANPGFSGTRFSYGSGPNFRMVIALRPTSTTGRNVIPGGQSGLTNSPFFSDQARLWLGNQTMPMYLAAPEVVAHAMRREHFRPAGR